ncbi:hypothetical protein [Catellatospora coxensis]|uniref:Uncharacterized protein n=1 Tax=Catellatospora coxensis TaxID=310354 RepID=A0A8J3L258_9ACTN|nr:hypothetical protein [Catellatospora coxensis]GIG07221.1 hypothetical protein Cco03nite_39210 [Catellatospora coxensis]
MYGRVAVAATSNNHATWPACGRTTACGKPPQPLWICYARLVGTFSAAPSNRRAWTLWPPPYPAPAAPAEHAPPPGSGGDITAQAAYGVKKGTFYNAER